MSECRVHAEGALLCVSRLVIFALLVTSMGKSIGIKGFYIEPEESFRLYGGAIGERLC